VVGGLQWLGDGREPPLTDLYLRVRIGEQVQRPLCAIAGSDQDRSIRLIEVTDRDRSELPRSPPPRRQSGDLAPEEEVVADVVVRRQRARCQDLPSVWVDGA
jgi:hypothetical protein